MYIQSSSYCANTHAVNDTLAIKVDAQTILYTLLLNVLMASGHKLKRTFLHKIKIFGIAYIEQLNANCWRWDGVES